NGHVKAFSGRTGRLIDSFFAYSGSALPRIQVGLADFNADGRFEIRTSPSANADVRTFDGTTQAQLNVFLPFPGFGGGAAVGGAPAFFPPAGGRGGEGPGTPPPGVPRGGRGGGGGAAAWGKWGAGGGGSVLGCRAGGAGG